MCVYLLHFSRKVAHAQHYIGFTRRPVEERVAEHWQGHGSPLVQAALNAGIDAILAKVWKDAPRDMEQRLKRQHNNARYCPICRATARPLKHQTRGAQ